MLRWCYGASASPSGACTGLSSHGGRCWRCAARSARLGSAQAGPGSAASARADPCAPPPCPPLLRCSPVGCRRGLPGLLHDGVPDAGGGRGQGGALYVHAVVTYRACACPCAGTCMHVGPPSPLRIVPRALAGWMRHSMLPHGACFLQSAQRRVGPSRGLTQPAPPLPAVSPRCRSASGCLQALRAAPGSSASLSAPPMVRPLLVNTACP